MTSGLNLCRCGNRPELVTQRNGLVRISCVIGKCPDLICARSGVAESAWNEANPADEAPTLPMNDIPKAEPYLGQWTQQRSVLNSARTLLEIEVPLPEDWSAVP